MGIFVATNPPILKKIPSLPEGFQWRFEVAYPKMQGSPALRVSLLKKRKLWGWTEVTYQICHSPSLPNIIAVAYSVYESYQEYL